MNVLITSASRKVWLVRAFQAALRATGGGEVVAADVVPEAAALHAADRARLVPRSDTGDFVPRILELCRGDGINLVVPTRDEELPVFAAARETFAAAGVHVLVNTPDAIDACQDKRRFAEVCLAAGIPVPRLVTDPGPADLPLFVKPRRGKGGRGAGVVHTRNELTSALETLGADAIVQELIDAPEFTIDLFADGTGRTISIVPRRRVVVVGGESWVGRTVRDPLLRDLAAQLAGELGLVGHVTIQAFRRASEAVAIEVNPRYGGGAALGFAAGAPTPEYAVRLARGERVEARIDRYDDDLLMLRFTDDLFLPGSALGLTSPATSAKG